MAKIIIGIHGLANKPPRETLDKWWRQSITEGLKINCKINPEFNFRMVYWADLLYFNQLHRNHNFSFDALYNNEPYGPAKKGALKRYKDSRIDDWRAGALDIVGTGLDKLKKTFGMDRLADGILGRVLRDLAFYNDDTRSIGNRKGKPELARKVLRSELKNALIEEKAHTIMLIGHSMGSIIAYDVLHGLSSGNQDVKVSHFVTIGSPLGLPHVKGKIIQEHKGKTPRTPAIVTKSWVNYADRKDPVALDVHLDDDYEANEKRIAVKDDIILNDYSIKKKSNHHKSYGYLRTPELSEHVKDFLGL